MHYQATQVFWNTGALAHALASASAVDGCNPRHWLEVNPQQGGRTLSAVAMLGRNKDRALAVSCVWHAVVVVIRSLDVCALSLMQSP
jgi:hypothetical protein